jgi:hypothetical protein
MAGWVTLVWLGLASWAWPRVGEMQPDIENRLLADGTAKRIAAPIEVPSADDENGATGPGAWHHHYGPPQNDDENVQAAPTGPKGFDLEVVYGLMEAADGNQPTGGAATRPPDLNEHIYFKTDDGSPAAAKLQPILPTITGWEYHIILYKGISVLEIYRRIGVPLADAEVNHLLDVNRNGATWGRDSADGAGTDDNTDYLAGGGDNTSNTPADTYLGYTYQRDDNKLRAIRKGNDLVIFSTGLDKSLAVLKFKLAKLQNSPQSQASAQNSTRGF